MKTLLPLLTATLILSGCYIKYPMVITQPEQKQYWILKKKAQLLEDAAQQDSALKRVYGNTVISEKDLSVIVEERKKENLNIKNLSAIVTENFQKTSILTDSAVNAVVFHPMKETLRQIMNSAENDSAKLAEMTNELEEIIKVLLEIQSEICTYDSLFWLMNTQPNRYTLRAMKKSMREKKDRHIYLLSQIERFNKKLEKIGIKLKAVQETQQVSLTKLDIENKNFQFRLLDPWEFHCYFGEGEFIPQKIDTNYINLRVNAISEKYYEYLKTEQYKGFQFKIVVTALGYADTQGFELPKKTELEHYFKKKLSANNYFSLNEEEQKDTLNQLLSEERARVIANIISGKIKEKGIENIRVEFIGKKYANPFNGKIYEKSSENDERRMAKSFVQIISWNSSSEISKK